MTEDRCREHVLRDERGRSEISPCRRPCGSHASARLRHRLRHRPRRRGVRGGCRRRRRRLPQKRGDAALRGRRRRRDRLRAGRRAALDRVRAFVRVQDGCSFSCSFCVSARARPSRSRRASAVLREVARRVDQGHREVVLTGVASAAFAIARTATPCRGSSARAEQQAPATTALVDRGEPRRRRPRGRAAGDADGFAPPARPAPVGRRRRAARDEARCSRDVPQSWRRSRTSI